MSTKVTRRTGRSLVLACILLTGCTPGTQNPEGPASPSSPISPLTDGTTTALIYEPDGSSLDIRATSKLVILEGDCLGIERPNGVQFLAAFPLGTMLEGKQVEVQGMKPVQVGGEITYTGSSIPLADAAQRGISSPNKCAKAADEIWLILPAD